MNSSIQQFNIEYPDSWRRANEIQEHILEWIKGSDKMVIGIDGYSAAGKSTILACLSEINSNVIKLHLDDFLKSSEERSKLMRGVQDKTVMFEKNWYRYDLVEDLLKKFKSGSNEVIKLELYDYDQKEVVTKEYDLSKSILVVEGIFLFHPELPINKYLDQRVYINVDFDSADEKREDREKKRWGEDYTALNQENSFSAPFSEVYRDYYNNYYHFGSNLEIK